MQDAGTVLAVLRERGRRGLPCDELYRQMFSKSLYLLAYGNIYSNQGAMTPGACDETADGMSGAKIEQIIAAMRGERYRFAPVRRVYIPKKNGKLRPLGLPSWSDKLVGEVVRLLLEAYYEPRFSGRSHGFRKGRGCHTALREIQNTWTGTVWFIEGDISDCFGSIDHDILIRILAEKIHDNRFLRLIRNMLKAGYLEDWQYHDTLSGTPQGGVVSPLLSNIYLDKLDKFAERELIPQYTRGRHRKLDRVYGKLADRRWAARRRGDRAQARDLLRQMRVLPSRDPMDPGYRRLFYIRYADDVLLGFAGPKAEAEQIKHKLAAFLRATLALELNAGKTLITHARTRAARFLGYEIIIQHSGTRLTKGQRSANGKIALRVPRDVITAQCARYRRRGKPWHRSTLQNLPDYDIVRIYGAEYRGVVNYYLLAQDVRRLGKLRWNAETSMLKTLAAKHKSTVCAMAARHKAKVATPHGLRTCFEARVRREGKPDLVARFGGIPLKHDRRAAIREPAPVPDAIPHKELIHRLRGRWCELCEHGATVAVHHVAKLADLGKPGPGQPAWAALMAKMRRKTLIVCTACHAWIHANPVANAA
ncbi:MAG TPA: reverse transcriptase domain-containing protein [Streptosporangiaceae bacterium]|jgi:group II intron reverse transcriptase/maturase|nr:reverse transcriptase domain-containing protein [Streptosporangiaceae bacterium]